LQTVLLALDMFGCRQCSAILPGKIVFLPILLNNVIWKGHTSSPQVPIPRTSYLAEFWMSTSWGSWKYPCANERVKVSKLILNRNVIKVQYKFQFIYLFIFSKIKFFEKSINYILWIYLWKLNDITTIAVTTIAVTTIFATSAAVETFAFARFDGSVDALSVATLMVAKPCTNPTTATTKVDKDSCVASTMESVSDLALAAAPPLLSVWWMRYHLTRPLVYVRDVRLGPFGVCVIAVGSKVVGLESELFTVAVVGRWYVGE